MLLPVPFGHWFDCKIATVMWEMRTGRDGAGRDGAMEGGSFVGDWLQLGRIEGDRLELVVCRTERYGAGECVINLGLAVMAAFFRNKIIVVDVVEEGASLVRERTLPS